MGNVEVEICQSSRGRRVSDLLQNSKYLARLVDYHVLLDSDANVPDVAKHIWLKLAEES